MTRARSIFDVEDWDETIREAKAFLDADPENHVARSYLLMLHEQKKQEKKEYSPKNSRRARRDLNSHSASARLRATIGKNLVEFAQMCGIRYETYRAIERDTKKNPLPPNAISAQNAELIALATGVCPLALMENRLVCTDGKTEYDYYNWYTYAQTVQYEHKKLESEWLRLFGEAIKGAICYDKDDHDNGSFLRVVRLALLIDQFQDIYAKPNAKAKQKRLVSSLLQTTNTGIAKAAIEQSVRIRKLLNRKWLP